MKLQNSSPMVDKVRVELTSRGGLYPALPSATYPYLCAVSDTSRNPVFYMLSALGLASMVLMIKADIYIRWWK